MATEKKKRTMGRQKIAIKKIEKTEARMVCFSKRRGGLFKKAAELSILCGAEVGIVVYSPAGKAFSFGHPSVDSVIGRYLDGNNNIASSSTSIALRREADVQELCRQHGALAALLEEEKRKKAAVVEEPVLHPSVDSFIGRYLDGNNNMASSSTSIALRREADVQELCRQHVALASVLEEEKRKKAAVVEEEKEETADGEEEKKWWWDADILELGLLELLQLKKAMEDVRTTVAEMVYRPLLEVAASSQTKLIEAPLNPNGSCGLGISHGF